MALHGSVGKFVSAQGDWTSYTEHLQHYFAANDVAEASKQSDPAQHVWTGHIQAYP